MTEKTIPRLMAQSIEPVSEFYTAMGFEITFRQKRHRPLPKATFDRAIHMGSLFADSKQDLDLAVKVLDRALRRTDEEPTVVQLVKLLVLRADVAVRQADPVLARELLARARGAGVDGLELADERRRVAELEAGL
ncbi:hypothetical protein [Nocardia fluminea]|uniref:hypothetical protein n=1 Tax=Nocardia fluminea TaxID=134984 RepID=UPI00365B8CEA